MIDRRTFLALASLLGAGPAAVARAVEASGEEDFLVRLAAAAEGLLDLPMTAEERRLMADGLGEQLAAYRELRQVPIPDPVSPALTFDPRPGGDWRPGPTRSPAARPTAEALRPPATADGWAFRSAAELGRSVARREVSSLELTRLYLERLERHDPKLLCVITLLAERALAEAEAADRALARGESRGPLHGVPWGAKDLLATRGSPTTWGAAPYRNQSFDQDASVVTRLGEAGAPLLAKLTLGELAWGDLWFGGKTRNPWNLEEGSSGSSAGSASAVAAGLVGFALGSETWGSIVSPCDRCGVSGLRPTFGRISRHGAMALSWSMDKLGPIARTVEDLALVFAATYGPDDRDPWSLDGPGFSWPVRLEPRRLRVGVLAADFERKSEDDADAERQALEKAALAAVAGLGVDLIPVELPRIPVEPLSIILSAEAAAAFDELTRSGRDDLLSRQGTASWQNVFRHSRFIPAVEYLQANRVRRLLIAEMARLFERVDAYLAPPFAGPNLLLTNLSGHPQAVVPCGFRENGTPVSITFVGNLFAEADLLALARAYQEATGHHLRHPAL
ncbi:MAG TPA: amidase [Thermoanaerobaculia bacterium]|nr:amidase [Thermoanaerobaculia bacterium]